MILRTVISLQDMRCIWWCRSGKGICCLKGDRKWIVDASGEKDQQSAKDSRQLVDAIGEEECHYEALDSVN
jgi:hypothetical protein